MKQKERSQLAMAMLVASLLTLVACANQEAPKEILDQFYASIIAVGANGHYLLNWTMITAENTDHVNRCMKDLGIRNVQVTKNISDLFPYDSQT